MADDTTKQDIFKGFQDRQATRRDELAADRRADTEAAIRASEIETRMTIEEGLAFLTAGGEREDAA